MVRRKKKEKNSNDNYQKQKPDLGFLIMSTIAVVIFVIMTISAVWCIFASYFSTEENAWVLIFPGCTLSFLVYIFLPDIWWNAKEVWKAWFNNNSATLRKRGVGCKGTILKAGQTGLYVNELPEFKITINYKVPNKDTFTGSLKAIIGFDNLDAIKQGNVVYIKYDPDNPKSIGWAEEAKWTEYER